MFTTLLLATLVLVLSGIFLVACIVGNVDFNAFPKWRTRLACLLVAPALLLVVLPVLSVLEAILGDGPVEAWASYREVVEDVATGIWTGRLPD